MPQHADAALTAPALPPFGPQFLVDRQGRVVARYWPLTPPVGMESRIVQLLA